MKDSVRFVVFVDDKPYEKVSTYVQAERIMAWLYKNGKKSHIAKVSDKVR